MSAEMRRRRAAAQWAVQRMRYLGYIVEEATGGFRYGKPGLCMERVSPERLHFEAMDRTPPPDNLWTRP